MQAVIEAFREDDEHDEHRLLELREARGSARDFRRLVARFDKRIGSTFLAPRATWRWPGRSVAEVLLAGDQADFVRWLAAWAHRTSLLILERSMQEAWHRAFDQYGRRV